MILRLGLLIQHARLRMYTCVRVQVKSLGEGFLGSCAFSGLDVLPDCLVT